MSLINPNNIDGQYPIAGQDNDSQGFRDNFTNIKNNFTIAYNELADLQGKVVLKSALSGGSIDNNMSYSILEAAQLKKAVETKRNLGTISGSGNDISWADGHFQYFTTSGDTTIGLSGWPTNSTYAKLRLQITTDTTNRVITFPAAVSVGLADIQGAAGQAITLPTAGVYLFELTTVDNGTTITIQDLLRNYDIVTTGSSGAFTSLNVSGNVLATGLRVFGNTTLGNVGTVSGQFHSVIGNITQTSSGGAVYINTTGNVLAAAVIAGAVTSTGLINTTGNVLAASVSAGQINTTGNVLASSAVLSGLAVNGNASVGLAGAISGQFHTVVGNITQTSSGGAVYINTTGNVLASAVNAGTLTSGNITIGDPIGAGSFGSNLTVKGTIEYKTQDQANNFSVNTTTKSLTLAPGGDQFLLLNINANCAIGYNATITQGHQTTVHVKNSAGGLAYVIVPNNNTTTGNAFIGLANGQVGTFVFTSYGTDAGNVMITVTR